MNIIMLDIETLSLKPNAFVTQVGYVIGDPGTGAIASEVCLNLDDREQAGRDINFDTIQWWMGQDPRVVSSVFSRSLPRCSPSMVFATLTEAVKQHDVKEVWASPAMFDLPILTSLWGGRKPWAYNQERDMMTVYKAIDPRKELEPLPTTMGHNALADARWQFEYLGRLKRLQGGMAKAYTDVT